MLGQFLAQNLDFVDENLAHAQLFGNMESPLKGAAGNVEFLLGWKKLADSA